MDHKKGIGIWKRAALYLGRKRSKSVILLVILFVLVTLALTGISIGSATRHAAAALRESLGGYFKVETDMEASANEWGRVTDGLIDEIMRDDAIRDYNSMNTEYMIAKDLALLPGRFTAEGDPKAQLTRFLANRQTGLHEYFYTRAFRLAQGRHIGADDSGKALVSETLAERNGIGIGDTIHAAITDDSHPGIGDAGGRYDFEVVGIYEIDIAGHTDSMTAECDMTDNFIFIDRQSGMQITRDLYGRDFYRNGAAFFLQDPMEMDAAVRGVQGLPELKGEGFKLTVNNKAYNDSMVPLTKLGGYVDLLVIVILVVGILLLSLIMTMWMRDRIHEIGILLCLGVKKLSVVGQHILEALVVAAAALLIAWPVSGAAAGVLGETLLQSVPQEEHVREKTSPAMLYGADPVDMDQLEAEGELNVTVGGTELAAVAGFTVLILFVSVGLSSIVVVRMKPKDILSSEG